MNLEISKEECQLLVRRILHGRIDESEHLAFERLFLRIGNLVPVPLESNGPKRPDVPSAGARKDEQLPGGVSGRPQSSDQPQRTPQTVESVRMSTGKFDREAVEQITVTPTRIERKDLEDGTARLKVMWPARGRGFLEAACWDESLFAWVAGRIKQETVFYVVHKGKYTNIVGVKA
jgi:hypothetical protein